MKLITTYALAAVAMLVFYTGNVLAAGEAFEGRKKCSSCHKSQAKSWGDTAHAESDGIVKTGSQKEAKLKAKLDPAKDYTQEKTA